MIWLTWRQFRSQAGVVVGALLALAIALSITGPQLVHLYDTTVAACSTQGDCGQPGTNTLTGTLQLLQVLGTALIVAVPGLLGAFWGAPLITRELEAGTHRLAWTQSVTRTRWLAVKLGVVGAATVAVVGLLSLAVTWWSSPVDRVSASRFGVGMVGERNITPIGYAAFAFVLGVAAGLVIRRTLPAMATTLAGFLLARFAFTEWVRPHLISPAHRDLSLNLALTGFGSTNGGPFTLIPMPPSIPNAWIYSARIVDRVGHSLTPQVVARDCPHLDTGPPVSGPVTSGVPGGMAGAAHTCLAKVGAAFHEVVTYQPAGRYWAFQWYETAIFVLCAVCLAGCCFWWIRHRPS